ncbi:MAG: signal peptide peptidase SppA [Candidatus Kapabacteria bacterium]|nr:signal peptide peptidase SppA [Candidatus Kapabacteria bacterium]
MQDNSTPIPPPPGSRPNYIPSQSGATMPPAPKRSRWWIPVAIIGGILVVGAVIFFVVIGALIGGIFAGMEDGAKHAAVKDKSVLVIDLSGGLPESSVEDPFAAFTGGSKGGTSLYDVLQAIEKASADDKIHGLYITGGASGAGMAKLSEVRQAILNFKKSKKFVYAYMDMATKAQYFLASAADSIYMPEEGIIEFTAFGASAPFMKGLYNKLGVTWHVEQFEEYKSAAETMSRDKWSEPAREEVRALLEQRTDMFLTAVAESRRLEKSYIKAVMDHGVYLPDTLKYYRLIDGLVREQELKKRIHRRMNPSDTAEFKKLRTVSVAQYIDQIRDRDTEADKGIAIVYASGVINSGKQQSPIQEAGIYSQTFIKNLKKAAEDEDVDGIVIRIDSPGGSAFASDEMWAAIQEVRKRKPVYASMSDVAASGGYYMAMACDTIITHPATITGSIGVIMALPNFSGTMGKIGVTVDTIAMGGSANFMNPTLPLTDAERERLHEYGANTYRRFVQKVATSRKKDYEATRLLARGRVWTGEAALANGLADISGGLNDAIAAMKTRLGVESTDDVKILRFPKHTDGLEALLEMFRGSDETEADENEASSPSASTLLSAVVQRLGGNTSAAEQILAAMPRDLRTQVDHTASITRLAMHERALMVLPVSFPLN